MNNYINDIKTSFSYERKKDAFEFSSLFLFCTEIFSENTVSPTNVSYHHVSVLKKKSISFQLFPFFPSYTEVCSVSDRQCWQRFIICCPEVAPLNH